MPLVNIKIDGRETKAEQRSPLLGAIRSLGIPVPTLCQLDGLEPYGVCRMCIVEVKRDTHTRLVTSCNFPCEEGLEVRTDTERVRQHRRIMAELLLARCPDIPKVREIAASVGVEKSRFKTVGEPSDCVMCGLCVRVCDQIAGASALSFIGRGNQRVVGTPWSVDPDACIACGACAYVCPTGAMHMEEQTVERLRREMVSGDRLCRYARMGLISHKICSNAFRCSVCDVDQRLFEELGTHPILVIAPGLRSQPKQVGPFDVMEDRFYSPGHTWVKLTRDQARVGMDDFARKLVGPVGELTLHAKPADAFKPGDPAVTVASNGRKVTLRFPISGTVTHVNQAVLDDPALVDEDCYERGWLLMVRPDDFYAQSWQLVSQDEVESWIEGQSQKLAQNLKAKGINELTPDFAEKLNQADFLRLEGEFFKPGAKPE